MKIFTRLSLVFGLLLLSVTTFAQDCSEGPGLPGIDPDAVSNGCPLDTWVVALVVIAGLFFTYNLYKKQKMQQAI